MDIYGKPLKYWLELEYRAKENTANWMRTENLIIEIATLRAKVSFYEDRLEQMVEFKGNFK